MFNTKNKNEGQDAAGGQSPAREKNSGQVLVLVALSLVVFIGFAALAIDFAYFYHTRHQLQGAADAAALAGAALLDPSKAPNQQDAARAEAARIASLNKAANDPVILASDGGNVPPLPGPLPDTNDITVGNWDGSNYTRGGTPVNAVEVRARRTAGSKGKTFPGGTETNKGAIMTFFGGIFNIKTVNISATAIVAWFPAEVLPIAVNEYWLGWVEPPGPGNTKRPYDNEVHKYPRSFVRKTTIPTPSGGIDNVPSSSNPNGSWGRIFAILGSEAGSNVTPQNINSYVYLDLRSKRHDGSGASWFDLNPVANVTCATCSNGFYNQTGLTKTTGDVSPQKFREHLKYLHQGFPENYLLPTAVMEQYRAGYTAPNYPIPTSECPYATVAYFPSGGGQPINKDKALEDEYEGKKFYERFPKGKKVVALVYDGTYVPTSPSPNAVTIVGYVLLEIDGYASAAPQGLDLDKANNKLKDKGSTAYAHAISKIEEPSSSFGTCDTSLFEAVQALRLQGGSFRIVE